MPLQNNPMTITLTLIAGDGNQSERRLWIEYILNCQLGGEKCLYKITQ